MHGRSPNIREVPFGGRVITLNSPSSQQFTLEGTGEKIIAWEPTDREAMQVEVRARIMSTDAAIETFPMVRWRTEVSAGNAVWKEPFQVPAATTQSRNFAVPARGMVWRTGARQFRIGFTWDGDNASAANGQAVLQVSILPVWGTEVDTYPYAETGARNDLNAYPFPMTAREWRLYDADGLPIDPADGLVVLFVGLGGALFGVNDPALYADWRPVPFDAVAWGSSAGVYASYR